MKSLPPALEGNERISGAYADRLRGKMTIRRILVESGLSLVLMGLFAATVLGQLWTGQRAYNQSQRMEGEAGVSFAAYLISGHAVEALAENWESEFLQMAAFVWLTSFLFQKGSPESRDPYEEKADEPVTAESPWPARQGGWVRWLYGRSLGLTFLVLFLVSLWLHALGGAWDYSEELTRAGELPVAWWQYMGTARFWFESMQNWQSEFLSLGAMVVLSIYLRQKGSAESKPVAAAHGRNS